MNYFNFPIKMMNKILTDKKERNNFLRNAVYYHLYSQFLRTIDEKDDDLTDLEFFKQCIDDWGWSIIGVEKVFNESEKVYTTFQDSNIFSGISKDIYRDFLNNEKSDFDWECLCAFLALKSIIGNKEYAKTDNALLYARMSGKSNKNEFLQAPDFEFTEYKRNKIINKLQLDWGLKYYSRYTRGFYFSFKMSLEKLITIEESKRQSTRLKELKDKKKEILKKIQGTNE